MVITMGVLLAWREWGQGCCGRAPHGEQPDPNVGSAERETLNEMTWKRSALTRGSHRVGCAPPPVPWEAGQCCPHKASFLTAPVELMACIGLSPPPPGTPTQTARLGTEGPWVPCLHASPRMHTSVSFTWYSRSLALALMLKIGTQAAFVGERKEGRQAGRLQTKETANRTIQERGVLARGGGREDQEGRVPTVRVKVTLER